MRNFLLYLHIIGAGTWLGANFTQGALARGLISTSSQVAASWTMALVTRGTRLYNLAGALLLATYGFFLWIGSATVSVGNGTLRAGRAHIATALLGPAEPLDAEATRRVHGVDADARAFLVTRPYLKRSVLVPVLDPADPTPYWLVSTRHPARLAAALEASGGPGRPQA